MALELVRREPDPKDGRGVLVVATRKAVDLVAERRARLVETLEQGLAGMSRADRELLVSLLSELNDVLDPSVPAGEAPAGVGVRGA